MIFTSGSTGTPKGVAVTHRSPAAFVDAEARLFLPAEPFNTADRVLAGLSVAFDASCEETWLARRNGACLVPAPRSLVRTGMDVGPWNTYGPTEATVVACAARMDGTGPVRIGLPLDGWDLAVVDPAGIPVAEGVIGGLIIGGVGVARYLDPAKDVEKYAPMDTLGWDRAYRSGDPVRYESEGLVFVGRADEQVRLGAASNWAKSTPPSSPCRASTEPPPPSRPRPQATKSSSATSCPHPGPKRRDGRC